MKRTSGANHLGRLGALLGVLVLATACTGPKGDPGADGTNGTNGTNGANGTNGTNGANGADGGVGPAGPTGPQGPAGDAGPPGQNGKDGDAGANAIDKASVTGLFTDLQAGGAIDGGSVTLLPLNLTTLTDAHGTYRFDNVPTGMVKVRATTPRLLLSGSDLVPGTQFVATESDFIPLVAGTVTQLDLGVDRVLDTVLNIDAFHTAGKAVFKNANCKACHGTRAGQLSRVATIKTFHGIEIHPQLGCVFCHAATIDLVNGANVVIRKPVNTAVCKTCHSLYPTRFCTAATGTPPCP